MSEEAENTTLANGTGGSLDDAVPRERERRIFTVTQTFDPETFQIELINIGDKGKDIMKSIGKGTIPWRLRPAEDRFTKLLVRSIPEVYGYSMCGLLISHAQEEATREQFTATLKPTDVINVGEKIPYGCVTINVESYLTAPKDQRRRIRDQVFAEGWALPQTDATLDTVTCSSYNGRSSRECNKLEIYSGIDAQSWRGRTDSEQSQITDHIKHTAKVDAEETAEWRGEPFEDRLRDVRTLAIGAVRKVLDPTNKLTLEALTACCTAKGKIKGEILG